MGIISQHRNVATKAVLRLERNQPQDVTKFYVTETLSTYDVVILATLTDNDSSVIGFTNFPDRFAVKAGDYRQYTSQLLDADIILQTNSDKVIANGQIAVLEFPATDVNKGSVLAYGLKPTLGADIPQSISVDFEIKKDDFISVTLTNLSSDDYVIKELELTAIELLAK